MAKFKVGDRVAVYTATYGRETGVIRKVTSDGLLSLRMTEGKYYKSVHPKQCRRLVKKERPFLWAVIDTDDVIVQASNDRAEVEKTAKKHPRLRVSRLVEVRRKK